MPVGNEAVLAGPYTATYNGAALGIFEGDAGLPTLEQQNKGEPIANTSAYGKSTIDTVEQGADWFMAFTCLEAGKSAVMAAFWPFAATLGRMGTIGALGYTLAMPIVLTAVAGTSASASPATLTASKAKLATGFATRLQYGPTLRKVPLRFQLYPYVNTNVVWFTQT